MTRSPAAVDTGKDHDPKFLLDYLDRELASLQILLAFMTSILALSLGLVAKFGRSVAAVVQDTCTTGADLARLLASAVFLVASTYLFFQQRETIAEFYWQISVAASGYRSGSTVAEQLKQVDSWPTWIRYRWAWKFLTAGFVEVTSVVFRISFLRLGQEPSTPGWETWAAYLADAIVTVIFLWGIWQIYAFSRHPYDDQPMIATLNDLRRKIAG